MTYRISVAACAAWIALAPCVRAQDSVAAEQRHAPVARALARMIEHERAQKGIPAISIALVDGRRIVWAAGSGWADSSAGLRADRKSVV